MLEQRQATTPWYHAELDLLRFAAFCLVFLFHAGGSQFGSPAGIGAYGLDLFFTLSGYLITEILLREKRAKGVFDIRAFYIRRILRIWPLYFAFLTFVCLWGKRIFEGQKFPASSVLMFAFFVGNWQFLQGLQIRSVFLVLWSVCVEEQFYLAWPLLLRRWNKNLLWICGGLLLLANVNRIALYLLGSGPRQGDAFWRGTLSHLDPIVVGSMIGIALNGASPDLSRVNRLLLGSFGAAGLICAGLFGAPSGGRALLTYPLSAASCGVILISVLKPTRTERPGKVRLGLLHLGQISYGLYVFHTASLNLARRWLPGETAAVKPIRIVGAFVLTTLLAEFSYQILERPFLRLKSRFSRIGSGSPNKRAAAAVA